MYTDCKTSSAVNMTLLSLFQLAHVHGLQVILFLTVFISSVLFQLAHVHGLQDILGVILNKVPQHFNSHMYTDCKSTVSPSKKGRKSRSISTRTCTRIARGMA